MDMVKEVQIWSRRCSNSAARVQDMQLECMIYIVDCVSLSSHQQPHSYVKFPYLGHGIGCLCPLIMKLSVGGDNQYDKCIWTCRDSSNKHTIFNLILVH